MDATEALDQYRVIEETTRRMLAAARAGDWDTLVNLETDRKAMIERVTAQEVDFGPRAAEKDGCIRAILKADQEITRLTRAWMDEMQDMLATLRAQRKLAEAYHHGSGAGG